jgi:hypothetical protein
VAPPRPITGALGRAAWEQDDGTEEEEELEAKTAGLLSANCPTHVAEVLGQKGYRAGLEVGQRGINEMQTLSVLRKLGQAYSSATAWVQGQRWNENHRAEAEVLAKLIDTLASEAGGHHRTVGTQSMEIACRRLQALDMLEAGGGQAKRNARAWMEVVMEVSGGMGSLVSATATRDLNKLHSQIYGGKKGGKTDE